MSGVPRPRKLAVLLAAALAAMMLSVGPAAAEAEAVGKHHWKKPHWKPHLKLVCAVAQAGGALAVACPHDAEATAGDTTARAS